MKTVVSLTTIPSRVVHLGKVLESIEHQAVRPDAVELNIPYAYKKRKFPQVDLSQVPKGFEVFFCEDFGPATKVLPTLQRYKGQGVNIIYCDDDRIYNRFWLRRLLSRSLEHPASAIADDCRAVEDVLRSYHFPKKGIAYRLKRALTLGAYKPYKVYIKDNPEMASIAEGFGGVLVKPDFFLDSVYDVPEECWPVDDIWLSANLNMAGADIFFTNQPRSERSEPIFHAGCDMGRSEDSLTLTKVNDFTRRELDYFALKYCVEQLGAWPDKKKYFV